MSDSATLADAVSSIERTAERKTAVETVDEKVTRAERQVNRLSDDLEELATAVEELQFYRRILAEAYGGEVPATVHSALEDAEDAAGADREALIEHLESESITAVQSEIDAATDSVEHATRRVKSRLEDEHWTKWENRISKARELQDIVGVHDTEFANAIDETERYIKRFMRDPEETTANVISGWEKVTAKWDRHQDLQGLSSFKQTHGLSDDAIDVVRQLSQDSVTLAEVDTDVLQELKDVSSLEEAVTLEI